MLRQMITSVEALSAFVAPVHLVRSMGDVVPLQVLLCKKRKKFVSEKNEVKNDRQLTIRLKVFWQIEQGKGRSVTCDERCRSRCSLRFRAAPHSGQMNGRSVR